MPANYDKINVRYFRLEIAQQLRQLCILYQLPTASDPMLYAIEFLPRGLEYSFMKDYVNVVSNFMGVTELSFLDHVIAKNLRDPYVDHPYWEEAFDKLRNELEEARRANR